VVSWLVADVRRETKLAVRNAGAYLTRQFVRARSSAGSSSERPTTHISFAFLLA
jgi:hypothetical protein